MLEVKSSEAPAPAVSASATPASTGASSESILSKLFPTRQYYSDTNPERAKMPTTLMARPKFNTSGKPASININSHKILEYPKKKVYQYDVS